MKALLMYDVRARAWRDTVVGTYPTGTDTTISWEPPKDRVYFVYGIVLGKPRESLTGVQITGDDFKLYLWHKQMRQHRAPGVESIYDFPYGTWLEVTSKNKLFLQIVNDYTETVMHDFTILVVDVGERGAETIRRLLQGYFNWLYFWGGFLPLEIDEMVRKKKPAIPILEEE